MTTPQDAALTRQINAALAAQAASASPQPQNASSLPTTQSSSHAESFWHRPGGVAAIAAAGLVVVAIITGAYTIAGSDKPSEPAPITNCAQQQKDASELQKANPGVPYTYSGGSEDQCHLNSVTLNIREGQQNNPSS